MSFTLEGQVRTLSLAHFPVVKREQFEAYFSPLQDKKASEAKQSPNAIAPLLLYDVVGTFNPNFLSPPLLFLP